MRESSTGNTGYTGRVAKVMVSLPDELLAALDAEAARLGATRSGLLRSYADDALRDRSGDRARRVEQVLAAATAHGGDGVIELKRHRPPP